MGDQFVINYELIFYLVLFIISFALIAFLVSVRQFLKRKEVKDKELLLKMDELINLKHQSDK